MYVVEDDEASAMAIEAVLKAHGFSVATFASAEQFHEALPQLDEKACLVLDVRLPGMSGLELQKLLVLEAAMMPVVMISGHADQAVVAQALENGAAAFLQKPFPGNELSEAIRKAMSRIR